MSEALVRSLRAEIRAAGDPERAEQQQAYMKSQMPYAGVQAAPLRALGKMQFKAHPIDHKAHWLDAAASLWRGAEVREERYSAIELLLFPRYRKRWLDPDCLPLIEEMIVSGAWWDYVDNIASNLVGALLAQHRAEVEPIVRSWAESDDLWLRRTSILCQLKFKADTDLNLLSFAIRGSITDPDFFARKAIGWSLRAYSRTDPDWVRHYVATHEAALSNLSKREALKLIG